MYYTPPEITNDPERSTSGYLKIVNTRIGIVNFKVNFDWQVGTWRNGNENGIVELKITGTVGNKEVVSYTTEVNVGQDTSSDPTKVQEYYFKNLPKYDSCGRVINYKLEEITINGQSVQTNADDEQYFMLKDNSNDDDSDANRCVVTITEEDYTQGNDANSNDLITYTIKNQFSDDIADFTINKRWADNHNRYKTRPDIYIRMHRIAIGDADAVDETIDYRWTPSSGEITQEGKFDIWTYHFDKLTKYDDYGRRYLYYVEELPIAGNYETTYEQNKNATAGELRLWESINVDGTKYAFNNGTITNRLYGTVTIHGSKLWEKIDPRFANDKTHYPIADVYLYRKDSTKTYTDNTDTNGKKIQDARKGDMISETQIFYADNNFKFSELRSGLTNGDVLYYYRISDNNLVLPKYDQYGCLITYSLNEKPISGYAMKIGNQEIINTYDGGDPVRITVKKNWKNMDEYSVYPNRIRVTLHQKFTAKDYQLENDSNPQTYDWTYQKYLTRDKDGNWSCTFGGETGENFRVYAPNGEKFQYSVEEELIPYQGEPITLTNNSDSGLGFTYECTGIHYSELSQNGETANTGYVEEEATITNTYHPQNDNFKGLVIVNKNWNYNDENNDSNSTEFTSENDYKFTLKRKNPDLHKGHRNIVSMQQKSI